MAQRRNVFSVLAAEWLNCYYWFITVRVHIVVIKAKCMKMVNCPISFGVLHLIFFPKEKKNTLTLAWLHSELFNINIKPSIEWSYHMHVSLSISLILQVPVRTLVFLSFVYHTCQPSLFYWESPIFFTEFQISQSEMKSSLYFNNLPAKKFLKGWSNCLCIIRSSQGEVKCYRSTNPYYYTPSPPVEPDV